MEEDIERRFLTACEAVKQADLDPETILNFYGLYKQALYGPPDVQQSPSGLIAMQKYQAWKSHSGKTPEEAKSEYIALAETVLISPGSQKYGNTVSRFTIESTVMNPESAGSELSEIDVLCSKIRDGFLDTDLLGKLTVNVQDSEGLTPLHHAADSGQVEIVHELIDRFSADVNKQDLAGMTPLHYAVVLESSEVVKEILKHPGVDVDIKDREGQKAVDLAVGEIRGLIQSDIS